MVRVLPTDVVGSGQELVMIPSVEDACPAENETSVATPGGNANERDVPVSLSSWEDITALFKSIHCFTVPEPSTPSVNVFFPLTQCHFVELSNDPCLVGVALRSLYFGVLIKCRSILPRRQWKW